MKAIQNGNYRKAVASWRQKFRKRWRECSSQGTNEESPLKYHTEAAAWTCGCKTCLLSRFLRCKHIVSCYQDLEEPNNFFKTISRKQTSPFWVQPQLILRPKHQPADIPVKDNSENSNFQLLSDFEFDEESEESSNGDL